MRSGIAPRSELVQFSVVFGAFALAVSIVLAQGEPKPQDAAFEVVSIRPSTAPGATTYGTRAGGAFYATNISTETLVRLAYGVQNHQIKDGPSWLTSQRFNIDARAGLEWAPSSPTAAPATLAPMLRSLLRERFAFEAKWEKQPGDMLLLVRNGATLGPRLTQSTSNCVTAGDKPPGPEQKCGLMMRPGLITAASVSMAELAVMLSQQVGMKIVDDTDLSGRFDVKLEFRPENLSSAAATTPTLLDTPALPSALEEQLGLALRRQEGSVDVLRIVRVERPTAN